MIIYSAMERIFERFPMIFHMDEINIRYFFHLTYSEKYDIKNMRAFTSSLPNPMRNYQSSRRVKHALVQYSQFSPNTVISGSSPKNDGSNRRNSNNINDNNNNDNDQEDKVIDNEENEKYFQVRVRRFKIPNLTST